MSTNNLNENQLLAVNHKEGPLLIIAGAGTGKTKVIIESIKKLILNNNISPQNILAVTFTNKASLEMQERLGDIMPLGFENPKICTFHTFCEDVLRDYAIEIGLDPTFKLINQTDSYLLFKNNLFNFPLDYFRPLGNPNKFIIAILKFFSRLSDELVTAEEFEAFANSIPNSTDNAEEQELEQKRYKELAKTYTIYRNLKNNSSFMDFGDLVYWTISLFTKRPNILLKVQKEFRFVFVDEFQDTNWAQYQLLKLLCPSNKNPNLTVVGDDNQSIYKFRGASISNILDFKKDYENAQEIILNKNYRSNQDILDASYSLIKNNDPDTLEARLKISKKLISQKGALDDPSINFQVFNTEAEEADFVCKTIKSLMDNNPNLKASDFAVLARANNHLDPIIATLRQYNIPYKTVGNRGLFDTDEISLLISLLRFTVDPENDLYIYKILTTPALEIPHTKILKLLKEAKQKNIPLWDLVVGENFIDKKEIDFLKNVLVKSQRESVSKLVYSFLMESGVGTHILENDSLENRLKIDNINRFLGFIKNFEKDHLNSTALEFVKYLDLALESGENPPQAEIEDFDCANLITAHGAKGLEFPVVFLISLTSDRFPSRNRGDIIEVPDALIKESLPTGDFHQQEERRLFYVALTRAKDKVFLSFAKSYGGLKEKKPSGFIAELKYPFSTDIQKVSSITTTTQMPKKPLPTQDLPFVSYSQISMFESCPKQYEYRYYFELQTPPHHAFTFGQSIHKTLRDFEQQALVEKKALNLEELLRIYNRNFDQSGYESKEHKEKRFQEGQEYLKMYFAKGRETLGKPLMLEKNFRILVGETALIGFIDRIDEKDGHLEIVDYKTGQLQTLEEVSKNEQLFLYILASKKAFGLDIDSAGLYFIEDGQYIKTTNDAKKILKCEEKVKDTIIKIKEARSNKKFPAKTGILCKYCSYNDICPDYKNYLNL